MLASKRKNEFYLPHISDKDLETHREIIGQIQKVLELNFALRFVGAECEFIEGTSVFRKLKLFEVLSSVPPEAPNGFSWVRREDVGAIQISSYDEDILHYLKEYSRDGL